MNGLSASDLSKYCAPLLKPDVFAKLATKTGLPVERAAQLIHAVCNEAHTGLRLLELAGLRSADRVLEVGAGGGVLSGYLQSRGINLTAIEPAAEGFEFTAELSGIVRGATEVATKILPLAAEQLAPALHGTFDVIFSVNVIEHFQPMGKNLDALCRVMGDRALQIHTCPNYLVPYEPHYGIPLLPFAPRYTPFLGCRRSEKLWRSLNFITSADLQAYARRSGLKIRFKQGTLSEALVRLCEEPAFAARHPLVLYRLALLMKTAGLTSLLGRLPPPWVTPMTAILQRQ